MGHVSIDLVLVCEEFDDGANNPYIGDIVNVSPTSVAKQNRSRELYSILYSPLTIGLSIRLW